MALGGNVGPVEQTFHSAIESLTQLSRLNVLTVSSFHGTRAVGSQAGNDFLNAALLAETSLEPLDLLDELQRIELALGRIRDTHWGPRTCDLDLICYGETRLHSSRLTIPHPACWYRRFVLDPVVEIAADFIHPEKGMSFQQLRNRLLVRPLPVVIAHNDPHQQQELIAAIQRRHSHQVCLQTLSSVNAEQLQPALFFRVGRPFGPEEFANQPSDDLLSRLVEIQSAELPQQIEDISTVIQAALG